MPEIFISYSKTDRTHALDLAGELRAHGFSVWIDQGSIGGAKNWAAEIVEAIDGCSTFVCLLSPNSLASHNVAKELQLASEKQKNILPILMERVKLPANFEYPLAGLQRVYYQDRPAIFQALELLHGVVATEQVPTLTERMDADDSIRIAVLPFDDLSPNHDNQWFADGMMDELISTLGSLEHVKVPSRSDVLHYRNHPKQSREIAREVGVRYLIEGGVRKANEKIRINASLTDALRGEQLWANKFDGSFDDVFAFQELVAINITAALKLKLTPQEKEKVEEHGTENAEAYELYLKGRHEQYYVTKESYLRALELYEQAAKLDPAYELAQVGAASICCVYYREYSKEPKWLARAEAILATLDAIAGETWSSLYIRGMIEWLKGDDQTAIATLTGSIKLHPKNHNAYNVLGVIHLGKSNYSAAAEAFQCVTEIVESTQGYFNLLSALERTQEKERVVQIAQKALPVFDRYLLREPDDQGVLVSRAFVLFWANNKEEAAKEAERLVNSDNLSGQALINLGSLFQDLGKPERYISLLRKAIDGGFREIEQTRNHTFEPQYSAYDREFKMILQELEALIRDEKNAAAP